MALGRRKDNTADHDHVFVSEAQAKERERRAEHAQRKVAVREANAAAYAERTPAEQITVLDARLGVGVGAAKERKALSEKAKET